MRFLFYIILLVSFNACVEPFEFETRNAEGILVVQATLTDVFEKQMVVLSRAADLSNVNINSHDTLDVRQAIVPTIKERMNPEIGATVKLVDDQGNKFDFEGVGEGLYESTNAFALNQTVVYQLQISTSNNETYESEFESLAGKSQINDLYAERNFNENGEEGVTIFVDGADSNSSSDYFRYEYQETYKIIAPNYNGLQLEIIREEFVFVNDSTFLWPDAKLVRIIREEQVCYNSESSKNINLANTNALASPVLEGHVVRFINRGNAILSHRYSLLLNQYVIDSETFNYYQNLNNFAQSESVFSEIQPGFLEGNIKRTDIAGGFVLGYFEVASVAKQRFFFNYVDFFPDEELPPFFGDINCERMIAPALGNPERDGPQPLGCPLPSLIRRTKSNEISYVGINTDPGECEGPYLMTPSICADCTVLGSNIKPDFWIE